MAKKEKPKTGKIPKRIAGVKVPKKLRKSGDALIAKANSPMGREMLAAGVAAVATAAAASRAKAATKHAPKFDPNTPPVTNDVNVDRIVDAVSAVASSFLQKMRDRQA